MFLDVLPQVLGKKVKVVPNILHTRNVVKHEGYGSFFKIRYRPRYVSAFERKSEEKSLMFLLNIEACDL